MTNNEPLALTEKDLADLAKLNAGNYVARQPEPETIGDWAGHTPTPDATESEGEQLNLKLLQRERGTITQQVFGLEPYIILRPTITEDDGDFVVNIEAGGGADLASLGEFLEAISEGLQEVDVSALVAAAIEKAARENDDEDDSDQ